MSGSAIELSASDLSGFLSCIHLTALDLAVTQGKREPPAWVDPALIVLRERGLEHERGYVDELRARGLSITDLDGIMGDDAVRRSVEAIRGGADVILQPSFRNGRWFGRPDVLRRNGLPSALGAWSYEVVDTKLAKETRGGTILQLGLYSELLGDVQGRTPECFHVVTPDPVTPVHTYRVDDFAAYFRLIRNRLEATSLQDHALLAAENITQSQWIIAKSAVGKRCAIKREGAMTTSLSSPACGDSKVENLRRQALARLRSSERCPYPCPSRLDEGQKKLTSASGNRLACSLRGASKESPSTNCCCR